MKLLDPGTIILLSALLSLMMSAILMSISRGVANVIDGVTSWAVACLLLAIGGALFLTHGVAPVFVSIILSNAVVSIGTLVIYRGFSRFLGLTMPHALPVGLFGVYLVGMLLFTYVKPNYDARVSICMLFLMIVFGLSLRMIWNDQRGRRTPGVRLVAFALIGVMLAAFVRFADAVALHETVHRASLFDANTMLPYYLIANALSIVFLSVALVVLIHERLREELHELAAHDSLTGVLTRRVIMGILDKTVAKLRRTGESFALMMFDVDYFKKINDSHGHLAGDEVLSVLVRTIEKSLRTEDYIGRYGGEEFLVVLGNLNLTGITAAAERIRCIAEQTEVAYEGSIIRCTVSIGAAIIDGCDTNTGDLPVALADAALYEAKHSGRNKVVIRQH